MGIGRSRFGGGKEEGSGSVGIGRRGDNRQGVGNALLNDNDPVMRAGLQSSNLT